ncbi:uncharacterized protein LOC110252797 [Exaiptasia diaphana]|uniref:Uncharacterized protein n=1 Tax=Exaiptasia diaphana TaxID=2652724 RepID=A0A913Y552_EXADI|nr:uncharacterized protein LOC110252797 [Exaiptasia diaphana]
MHILLEGVIPLTIRLLLSHFTEDRHFFTLDNLNSRINGHNYNYQLTRTKPNIIYANQLSTDDPSTKLKQTASQMHVLLRLLPFYIHDYVDLDDEHWTLLKLLLAITSISFASSVTVETVSDLKTKIAEYLTLFKKLFPDTPLTPKQHFLVHFPRFILTLGPLENLWAMRFEAKHQYFKELRRVASYKNITYSVMKRHLQKSCADRIGGYMWEDVQKGPLKGLVQFEGLLRSISGQVSLEIKDVTSVDSCRWIIINGTKYVCDECVVLIKDEDEDESTTFAQLTEMYILNIGLFVFAVIPLDTVCFDDDLQSYEVQFIASSKVFTFPKDLASYEALHIIDHKGKKYISPRGYLGDVV